MFLILSTILASAPFIAPSDPLLRQNALELTKNEMTSEETQALVQNMKQIANERINEMAGLAAPQIGVGKRVILVNFNGLLKIYFNPQVIWRSNETLVLHEKCYSLGDIVGLVPRAAKIKLCAYNEMGEMVVEEYEGMEARILQHEVDHLNGIRFISHVDDLTTLKLVTNEQTEEFRKNRENWPHKCPPEKLAELSLQTKLSSTK
ncbi:MAG: Peptide deformylase [Chlamydiia bacterium]|nr:Peptide deformylase [Chlamydiia bacterium]MCH9614929.1 Peptide deformylase [Chlamydiia bacterium]MCH9629876.1 Peptide deformylase [Chlamydiia bacterium]